MKHFQGKPTIACSNTARARKSLSSNALPQIRLLLIVRPIAAGCRIVITLALSIKYSYLTGSVEAAS